MGRKQEVVLKQNSRDVTNDYFEFSVGYSLDNFLNYKMVEDVDQSLIWRPQMLFLSTTQRYSVYCYRGGIKPEHIHD